MALNGTCLEIRAYFNEFSLRPKAGKGHALSSRKGTLENEEALFASGCYRAAFLKVLFCDNTRHYFTPHTEEKSNSLKGATDTGIVLGPSMALILLHLHHYMSQLKCSKAENS